MIEKFFFGIYPYIALSVFVIGSWVRFDREQYSWKSDSSQLLSKGGMVLGSNLFHVGVLAILGGHFVGLLTPHHWFLSMGVADMTHQWVAIGAGALFGALCLIGTLILWVRRMTNSRVRAAGRGSDSLILTWILATLVLGLSTIPVSMGHAGHGDAGVMIALANYVQSIVTLQADPALLAGVDTVFKVHMVFGLTLFLLFPFTRLVHILTAPLTYLGRAYQIVRAKRRTI
jgi:nitrate reductase gamma subunit